MPLFELDSVRALVGGHAKGEYKLDLRGVFLSHAQSAQVYATADRFRDELFVFGITVTAPGRRRANVSGFLLQTRRLVADHGHCLSFGGEVLA